MDYSDCEEFPLLERLIKRVSDSEMINYVKVLSMFERNGVHLLKHKRQELAHIRKEIGVLEQKFQSNISEDNRIIKYIKEELNGCSKSFMDTLDSETIDGVVYYSVNLKV